ERDGVWQGESAMLDAGGREVPVSQVVIAHRAEGSCSIRFYSTIARDISEREAYEARIQHLAHYDALSGLPNRSLLGDRAEQAIAHARRTGRGCALLVVNLDRFKLFNDSYGHAAGDVLLKQVGERLALTVREATRWRAWAPTLSASSPPTSRARTTCTTSRARSARARSRPSASRATTPTSR